MSLSRSILKAKKADGAIVPVQNGPVEPLGPQWEMQPYQPNLLPCAPPAPGPVPDMNQQMEKMQREMMRMQRVMEEQFRLSPLPPAGGMSPGIGEPVAEGPPPPPPRVVAMPAAAAPPIAYPPISEMWPAPVIRNTDNGHRTMRLQLKVAGYGPEDIHINTDGHLLQISGRRLRTRNQWNAESRVDQEFTKQFALPEPVRAENLRCVVGPDGMLCVEGPLGPHLIDTNSKKRKVKFAERN